MGARSPREVDGWISAAATDLTDAEMEELAEAIRKSGVRRGLAMPADRS